MRYSVRLLYLLTYLGSRTRANSAGGRQLRDALYRKRRVGAAPTPREMPDERELRFRTSVESLSERVHRYAISRGATPLRWDEVMELWRTDRTFALFFTAMLAASPFESFFWECPASSSATLSAPFECVTIRAGTFAWASPASFAEHFHAGAGTATFLSLGGDATLVAPTGLVDAGRVGAGLVGAPGGKTGQKVT